MRLVIEAAYGWPALYERGSEVCKEELSLEPHSLEPLCREKSAPRRCQSFMETNADPKGNFQPLPEEGSGAQRTEKGLVPEAAGSSPDYWN